jgi:hypothetical protein
MIAIPNRPQTVGELIKTGFRIWTGSFRAIVPLAIIFATLTILYEAGLHALGIKYDYNLNVFFYYSDRTDKLLILTAVFLVFVFIINAAMLWRMHAINRRETNTFMGSLVKGFKKSFVFFMACILTLSMVLGGTVLFIVPGVVLSVSLIFAPYLAVISNEGLFGSIRESFRLVSSQWWFTATAFFAVTLGFLVLSIFVGAITIGLDTLRGLMTNESFSVNQKEYISYIIDFVVIMLLYPLFNSCIMAMLYDLQVKKK